MSLLEVKDITFSYQQEQLYHQVSMRLFEKEHAVLVGPNGAGKSTLLKLLDKQLKPDSGQIEWLPGLHVGYLDQYAQIPAHMLVKDYIYEVYRPLFDLEQKMEALYEKVMHVSDKEQEKLLDQAASIGETLLDSNFYQMKSTIGNMIHGLGLSMDVLEVPISHLSGGMRAKIILTKLLLEDADVLLLDEPTNFLDVGHIEWLAKFLNGYEKAFIVVSHNESFLSQIATTVFALEAQAVEKYKGNYEYYLKERNIRKQQQEQNYITQQKFIEKTESFIQKNITRASTTKRAQSRRKMLEKMVLVTAPRKQKTYHFYFPMAGATGRDVLQTKQLEIGYDSVLIDPIEMIIKKEEKVVITGKNGIGKSTFIKTILGMIEPLGGNYSWIDTAKIAYLEQASTLENTDTAFEIVHHMNPQFTKKEVMDLLAQHGITYEMANRPVESLSGGEKTKVRLALLKHQKGNVLVMDEPTNHLDVEAKIALKEALLAYQGTLILVSHERDFYEGLCDYEIALSNED